MDPIFEEEGPRARLALLLQHFLQLKDEREPWRVAYPLKEISTISSPGVSIMALRAQLRFCARCRALCALERIAGQMQRGVRVAAAAGRDRHGGAATGATGQKYRTLCSTDALLAK